MVSIDVSLSDFSFVVVHLLTSTIFGSKLLKDNHLLYLTKHRIPKSWGELWLMLPREQTMLGKDPDTPVDVVAAATETAASGVMMD
ncbi:hypothetical protein V6N11_079974 [Hibiscus sabdariffa]|uniref:Uncharacterized protein n=1 Tax=Hibiscus sabdariffa TaxID=183260 RepID=A0ABR2RXD8_9ROSI